MFSTRFNPALDDRVHNLRVASNAINNVIVYPGQSFSFNTWVGPRLEKNGYKEAPVVVAGELVPGIGGGVCQVSSTLYNAVLLANLRVVKRHNHSLPSAYIAMGRDATVVDNGQDFIFENNLNTPVLLVTMIESPYLRVAILGEKTNWSEVALQTEVLKVIPFETEELVDPALAPEERIKEQEGRQGYRVALWRIVRFEDGTERKYLENTSIYPPRNEKYKVGIMPDKERL
jgi:vancomycin resistance protein YoaR